MVANLLKLVMVRWQLYDSKKDNGERKIMGCYYNGKSYGKSNMKNTKGLSNIKATE